MSRYDFIRFGGFVNWADEDTDTFRKMKVCLPVKEPVEDDTKIGLISTDEDNPEEIAVSYSVRAAELIPWTDSFQEGYWKALIVAEANGAGTDVLLPMLKDAGLCLMECVFLMPANCFRSCAGCSRKWRKCLRLSHGMTGNILSGN